MPLVLTADRENAIIELGFDSFFVTSENHWIVEAPWEKLMVERMSQFVQHHGWLVVRPRQKGASIGDFNTTRLSRIHLMIAQPSSVRMVSHARVMRFIFLDPDRYLLEFAQTWFGHDARDRVEVLIKQFKSLGREFRALP